MNTKLNGCNHKISDRSLPNCLRQPTLVMGADVTHPPPDNQNRPSVAAVTASHDLNATKFNVCWRLQPPTQEMITDMESVISNQLQTFKNQTGKVPESIIYYRDGVSEGQYNQVLGEEYNSIRNACRKFQTGYSPLVTILVVQKRHHTRLFPTNPNDSEDRNFNVPAGTCVDTKIVDPTAIEFYMVSHASIQGVARPTKYHTLWDDRKMSPGEIETLTYYLCHLYARCTRAVSYPAPTYYAHLAAYRINLYFAG